MKSIFLADMHFHPHEVFSITINGRNSRLQDCIDVLTQIKNYAIANKIADIYCLGDFFHTRTKIDIELYNLAYDIFEDFHNSGLKLNLIAGNHDLYYKFSSSVTSLKPMAKFANVITTPTHIPFGSSNLIAVPYYERVDDFREAIASIDYSSMINPVFLLHAEYVGSYKAAVSKEVTKHGIDSSMFPQHYRYILMGHYHMMQKITSKIMYLESPLQVSTREILEDKFFYVFDSEDLTLLPITTEAPRFSVVEYPSEKVAKFCRQGATIEEAVTGNYVEVVAYETIKKNSTFHKLLQTARNVIISNKIKQNKTTNNNTDVDITSIDLDVLSEQFAIEHPHEYLPKDFLMSVRNQITKL